jgi:hypothetical protein
MIFRTRHHAIELTCVLLLLVAARAPAAERRSETVYRTLCDASAGIALDDRHFVVADDEHDILRIFESGRREPVGKLDLHSFLGTASGAEADIEAAARIGKRIYWITSHGRNSKGNLQPTRYRFFATDIEGGSPPELREVARPYSGLLADLQNEPKLATYKLSWASEFAAEEPGGLAIEGLAARTDGSLLVGFRNPVRKGDALLVPLLDPGDLLDGKKPRFGEPIDLDLGGRGIRSIDRIGDGYWLIAGPAGDKKKCDKDAFALYRWSGQKGEAAQRVREIDLEDISPEAVFSWPDGKIQILSDDGDREVSARRCKDIGDKDDREFRSSVVEP